MGELHDVLSDRGYICLDGQASAAIGAQLGRAGPPSMLTPREQSKAAPWSLSGVYGLGAFPWHTDGAISTNPPRWLLLRAVRLSHPTATELLDPDAQLLSALRRTVLRATSRVGQVRYLPAAVPQDGRWRLRWDPRTCAPQSGITPDEMEQQPPTISIEWRQDRLLIIDNFRLLHRRPAVASDEERVIERTYVWDV